jgi:hypothetical protein
VLAVLALVAGCDNGVPTIRNLKYSPNAANPGQMETISGTVDYTDSENDVSQGFTEIVDPDGNATTLGPDPIMNAGAGAIGMVNFSFPFTPPSPGFYFFYVWVVDLPGNSSNRLRGVIRVGSPN